MKGTPLLDPRQKITAPAPSMEGPISPLPIRHQPHQWKVRQWNVPDLPICHLTSSHSPTCPTRASLRPTPMTAQARPLAASPAPATARVREIRPWRHRPRAPTLAAARHQAPAPPAGVVPVGARSLCRPSLGTRSAAGPRALRPCASPPHGWPSLRLGGPGDARPQHGAWRPRSRWWRRLARRRRPPRGPRTQLVVAFFDVTVTISKQTVNNNPHRTRSVLSSEAPTGRLSTRHADIRHQRHSPAALRPIREERVSHVRFLAGLPATA
jgi:hypothetical protein